MKIVIAGRADEKGLQALQAEHAGVEFVSARGVDELKAAIADADAVYAHSIGGDTFRGARRLRWIQSQGAGVEWIANVPELVESDVVLTNTRGAHASTIAEHAFGLLLSLTRGLPALFARQREHQWARPEGWKAIGLSGLTFGTVGLGRIGSALAQRAHGFDMKVIAVDANANDLRRPDDVEQLWDLDGLPELLRTADVVAVALPYTAETKGLLGPEQLALLQPSAYLLVVSRGGIVDETALVSALRDGRLAGAGLDVTAQEPLPPESPLWEAPNLLITPHCSGNSRQTTELAWQIFADNVGRFVRGETLNNIVDKRRGY
jgi:phosphoglycerate dehydrogenase-like enzyme